MANGTIQLRMDEFLGINQTRGEQMDMRYATWAENIDTRHGKFKTASGFVQYIEQLPLDSFADNKVRLVPQNLFQVKLRHAKSETILLASAPREIYIYDENSNGRPWENIIMFDEPVSGSWSFINYEGLNPDSEHPKELTDIVFFTNANVGSEIIYLRNGNYERAMTPKTPANFGVVTQYNERIFGTAALDNPDRIWYSAPFAPENWELNNEIPEDGAGFIDYPTWDGDSFIALVPFGADLLAFKRNSLCVLSGTYPGEYTIYKAFGTEGPVAKDTICVYRNMVFFLTTNGIGMYDGSSIRTISRDAIYHITRMLNTNNTDVAKAVIHDGIYMCAVNLGLTDDDNPDSVIEYDIERGTYMLRTGFSVAAWCNYKSVEHGDIVLMADNNDKESFIYALGIDEENTYDGKPIHSVWESPFTDAGHKDAIKSAFRIYTLIEDLSVSFGDNLLQPLLVDFNITTERKTKTKKLKAQKFYEEKKKMLSKSVSNKGRQFKWKIESDIPFMIQTGIQVQAELDSD
jgi:hypothetical protein